MKTQGKYLRSLCTLLLVGVLMCLSVNSASAQTGWTKYDCNPTLGLGSSGSWDSVGVYIPSVIFDNGIYKMWYVGYNGSTWKIGYATSSDGLAWTKYSGNPVMDVGDSGDFDDYALHSPHVIKEGNTYKMWYIGFESLYTRTIGYATSSDGITWTKFSGNPVVDLGDAPAWDSGYLHGPMVINSGAAYEMWYGGYNGANYSIGYATSSDGTTWTKYSGNPVLVAGSNGSWDDTVVAEPTVILDGSTYRMWYQGMDAYSVEQIGYATSSDGTSWTKYSGNPVVVSGSSGSWDLRATNPVVLKDGSVYKMWYTGFDAYSTPKIGHAVSPVSCIEP